MKQEARSGNQDQPRSMKHEAGSNTTLSLPAFPSLLLAARFLCYNFCYSR
jgi:hypothetical protein